MSEKSILEQALLQVQNLEEAVKQNAKGILASTMKQELSDLLKESMEEEEEMHPMDEAAPEEEEKDDMSGEVEGDDEADEEGDDETETEPENDEEDLDNEPSKGIDDLDSDSDEEGASDMDDLDNADDEEGEDDTMDMTQASDDEVLKVFKAMKPQDGIVVKKDGNNVSFEDGEDEYIIKLDDEGNEEEEEFDPEMDENFADNSTDYGAPTQGNFQANGDMGEEEEESLYEIEIDEEEYAGAKGNHPDKFTYTKQKGGFKEDKAHANPAPHKGKVGDDEPFTKVKAGGELKGGHPTSTNGKEQDMDENARTIGHGYKSGLKSKKVAYAGNKREEMNESNLKGQIETLKKQNGEYKKALVLFKEKLNEVAVFNASLAYATRLFTEHSTTKQEKMNILKRFDSASTLNESKGLYNTITSELSTKTTVTESVVNKISAAPQTSSTEVLSEAKAYVNPQFKRMKDLMQKIK